MFRKRYKTLFESKIVFLCQRLCDKIQNQGEATKEKGTEKRHETEFN